MLDDKDFVRFMQRIMWHDTQTPAETSPMYERFTDRARKVMQLANQECTRLNHENIGTEHILLGLIKEGSGVASNVLKNLGLDLDLCRYEVLKIVQPGPDETPSGLTPLGKLPLSPRAKKVLEFAIEEARQLDHNYVGTEHQLLGLLRVTEGVAYEVLIHLGISIEGVQEAVLNLLGRTKNSEEADIALEAVQHWKVNPGANASPSSVATSSVDRMIELDHAEKRLVEVTRIASSIADPAEAMKEIKKLLGL